MKLVDRDELFTVVQADMDISVTGERNMETVKKMMQNILDDIQESPAIDLIRCKDCKHCETMTIFGKTTLYSCTRKNPAVDVLPSDYCSRGRRKDES